jgi:hypothetical protein
MWLIHTPTELPYRILAGLGIGIVVFVIAPLLIREAWPPHTAVTDRGSPGAVNVTGDQNVTSVNQSGGITTGTYSSPKSETRPDK